MRKKLISLLLALVMCLELLPLPAAAAETNLPDWYFLFAIFKNVDADCDDGKGTVTHTKFTMSQEEIDLVKEKFQSFEEYMNGVGVMRAHMYLVEIDTPVTELKGSGLGSYLGPKQAAPLLEANGVDLDRYDHVSCFISLNVATKYGALTNAGGFENGTGHSCHNIRNIEFAQYDHKPSFPGTACVHEFIHFLEQMSKKWGKEFDFHAIGDELYTEGEYIWRECYTDIILNQVNGDAGLGTGVAPAVWQYPPHVLRTMTELTIPSGVTSIGHDAFLNYTNLTSVTIPSSVTYLDVNAFNGCANLANVTLPSSLTKIEQWAFHGCTSLTRISIPGSVTEIGNCAFYNCTNLNELILAPGVTSIGGSAFRGCSALTRVTIPASVTSIGNVAFYNTGVTDVYYAGTEAQWKAIKIGEYNETLTKATIHYNHLMADVKTNDWFAKPVVWALEKGVASGTGEGNFSPSSTCTQGQILTFLWRACGSPEPSGKVSGSEYYAVPLQWAKEKKLVDESLSAKDPCTRSDVVAYLWKLAGSPSAKAAGFSDVPASASYAGAVNWAVENKITSGTGPATFSPDKACTRGQIVTFLYQALK